MNRKGFATGMLWFIVILVVIGFAGIITYEFFHQFNVAIQANNGIDTATKATMSTSDTRFHNTFDALFLTLLVGGTIGLMVTSYLLRSSPVLFWFMMIIVMLMGGVAGNLGNGFVYAITGTSLSSSAAQFPITSFVMNYYLFFVIILGFLMMISFFGNTSSGGYV